MSVAQHSYDTFSLRYDDLDISSETAVSWQLEIGQYIQVVFEIFLLLITFVHEHQAITSGSLALELASENVLVLLWCR